MFVEPTKYNKMVSSPEHKNMTPLNYDRDVMRSNGAMWFVRTIEINYWPKEAREAVQQADVIKTINTMCNGSVDIAISGKFFESNEKVPAGQYPLYLEISGPNWIDAENARRHVEEIGDYISGAAY